MSDNLKYYYLKLKDDFFDRPEIKAIEAQQNGYEYICIIQKMYLKSLMRNGQLMLTDLVPYDLQTLSHVLGHKQDAVKCAIDLFVSFGLCEMLEDRTIYMSEIQNFIGQSSTEADRKRLYRLQIDTHKQHIVSLPLNNGTNVRQMSDKNPPEIKIEKEKI